MKLKPTSYCPVDVHVRPKASFGSIADLRAGGQPQGLIPKDDGERLLRTSEVLRLTGMSRSSLYNRRSADEFVRPIHIGPRSVRFLESEVLGWIAARVAQRDEAGGRHA